MCASHCLGVSDRTVRAAVCAGGRDSDELQEMCAPGPPVEATAEPTHSAV